MHTIKVMSLIPLHLGTSHRDSRAQVPGKTHLLSRSGGGTALDNCFIPRLSTGLMALFIGLMQLHSSARASDAVEVTLVAEVRDEVDLAGRSVARLAPATVLQQGQEVFYTVRIHNPAAAAARDVVVVQRIPQNTTYVPNSAGGPGAEITFSADGGQTFAREGQVTIAEQTVPLANAARAAMMRPATPQDYTHIRWRLRNSLAPGAVALARFRAVFR